MHERIFRETPDGQIHAAYCGAIDLDSVTGETRDVVERSLDVFIENARLPHEAFATYLSVKALPATVEPLLLAELSTEYLGYRPSLRKLTLAQARVGHIRPRCVGPQRAGDPGLRAEVDVSEAE